MEAWKKRPLDGAGYLFVIVDALGIKVRRQEAVRSTSVLLALGVNEEGYREVLGLSLGASESESTWSSFFRSLKERGLTVVELIVSDDHLGLVKAAERYFQGAMWQRCQTHLMRNMLASTPTSQRALIVEHLRRLFRSETKQEARGVLSELVTHFEGKTTAALEILETAFDAATQVLVLPELYRCKLCTTNMCERLNEEVRRRELVIRIFPNDDSATRLIGMLLAEQHETWLGRRRCLDMEPYRQWKQVMATPGEQADVIRSAA